MMQAVGADLLFRTAWLDLSVTTDDVVITDTLPVVIFFVPPVDIFRGTRLVGPHRTAMNYD
jgi:hypothetical protein